MKFVIPVIRSHVNFSPHSYLKIVLFQTLHTQSINHTLTTVPSGGCSHPCSPSPSPRLVRCTSRHLFPYRRFAEFIWRTIRIWMKTRNWHYCRSLSGKFTKQILVKVQCCHFLSAKESKNEIWANCDTLYFRCFDDKTLFQNKESNLHIKIAFTYSISHLTRNVRPVVFLSAVLWRTHSDFPVLGGKKITIAAHRQRI